MLQTVKKLYCIIGPCRSGTTALLRSLTNHPNILGVYQPIKEAQRADGAPCYGIYDYNLEKIPENIETIIFKETIGHTQINDCNLKIFRDDNDIFKTKPVFIFRNPHDTFNSWKNQGWKSLDNFIHSYEYTFKVLEHVKKLNAPHLVLKYRELRDVPNDMFLKISKFWNIKDHSHFTKPYEYTFDRKHPRLRFPIDPEEHNKLFFAVSNSTQIGKNTLNTQA